MPDRKDKPPAPGKEDAPPPGTEDAPAAPPSQPTPDAAPDTENTASRDGPEASGDGPLAGLSSVLPAGLRTWWARKSTTGKIVVAVGSIAVAIGLVWWNSLIGWTAKEIEQATCDLPLEITLPWCEEKHPVTVELQSTAKCPSGALRQLLAHQSDPLGEVLGPDAQHMRICADTTVSARTEALPQALAASFPGCLVRAETGQGHASLFACTASAAVCATPFVEGANRALARGAGATVLLCLGNLDTARDPAQCTTDAGLRQCSDGELQAAGF